MLPHGFRVHEADLLDCSLASEVMIIATSQLEEEFNHEYPRMP